MKVLLLEIDGMSCTNCSGTIDNAIKQIAGVMSVNTSVSTNTSRVELRAPATTAEILHCIECIGFGAEVVDEAEELVEEVVTYLSTGSRFAIFGIDGMTCTSCSSTVEMLLSQIEGISVASVVLATNRAQVEYNPLKITLKTIIDEVQAIGFEAELLDDDFLHNKLIPSAPSDGNNKGDTEKKILFVVTSITQPSELVSTAAPLIQLQQGSLNLAFSQDTIDVIKTELGKVAGVIDVSIKGKDQQIVICYNDEVCGPRDFDAVFKKLKYSATVCLLGGFMMAEKMARQQRKEQARYISKLVMAVALTLPIVILTMGLSTNESLNFEVVKGLNVYAIVLFLLCSPVQWWVGMNFHIKAYKSAKVMSPGMDFLISTGTSAAYLYSIIGVIRGIGSGSPRNADVEYFETSAVLITVVLLGKFLESYARGVTASAIQGLSNLRPSLARLVKGAQEHFSDSRQCEGEIENMENMDSADRLIDCSLIHRGDTLRLVEGETIPADGIVMGNVGVDESMMTGESRVVMKTAGDPVYGGSVVVEGCSTMVVTACGDESALGKIVATVQEAQASKPAIQEIADQVARYFVPCIGIISAGTFIVWAAAWGAGVVPVEWYGGANSWSTHENGSAFFLFCFLFSLAVWVSSCPCAFGLATPTAILVATGMAAKLGVLIRKGAALQKAAEVNVVAFDKTGTLTEGKTQVSDFYMCCSVNKVSNSAPEQHPFVLANTHKSGNKDEEVVLLNCFKGYPRQHGMSQAELELKERAVQDPSQPPAPGILIRPPINIPDTSARRSLSNKRITEAQQSACTSPSPFPGSAVDAPNALEQGELFGRIELPAVVASKAAARHDHGSMLHRPPTSAGLDYTESQSHARKTHRQVGQLESSYFPASFSEDLANGNLQVIPGQGIRLVVNYNGRLGEGGGGGENKGWENDRSERKENSNQTTPQVQRKNSCCETAPRSGSSIISTTTRNDGNDGISLSCCSGKEGSGSQDCTDTVVLVGSPHLMVDNGVHIYPKAIALAHSMRRGGKVAVYMAVNGVLQAVVGVSDIIRVEAAATVAALHARGVKCFMVTGDELTTALAIGTAIGIPKHRIRASMKPSGKEAFIASLQSRRGKTVAFVGDGTNDSPALARADVGIAMASGTSIAVDSGDIVLCKDDISAVITALDISQKTMYRIKVNYFWALFYNVVLIPVAAGVLYPPYQFALAPMYAGFAMAASSVCIVLSSLMLMFYKQPPSVMAILKMVEKIEGGSILHHRESVWRSQQNGVNIFQDDFGISVLDPDDMCNCPVSIQLPRVEAPLTLLELMLNAVLWPTSARNVSGLDSVSESDEDADDDQKQVGVDVTFTARIVDEDVRIGARPLYTRGCVTQGRVIIADSERDGDDEDEDEEKAADSHSLPFNGSGLVDKIGGCSCYKDNCRCAQDCACSPLLSQA